jgi:hypothetical protein
MHEIGLSNEEFNCNDLISVPVVMFVTRNRPVVSAVIKRFPTGWTTRIGLSPMSKLIIWEMLERVEMLKRDSFLEPEYKVFPNMLETEGVSDKG